MQMPSAPTVKGASSPLAMVKSVCIELTVAKLRVMESATRKQAVAGREAIEIIGSELTVIELTIGPTCLLERAGKLAATAQAVAATRLTVLRLLRAPMA